ncbi:MAG: carboxypeptidase-like regulatory domain-containing protein, partial [Thermoanaerobaculales bacterium]|nr:carboxypeptidase-like regulatory domain-containing protein [Thermoanaerobaculales bacterium]
MRKKTTAGAFLVAALCVLMIPEATSETLDIQILVVGEKPPEGAWVEATAVGPATNAEKHPIPLTEGQGTLELETGQEETWQLRASAPGYWSPEVRVETEAEDPVKLTLWPAVPAAAAFRPERGIDCAEKVQLVLQQIPGGSTSREQPEIATIQCPILENQLNGCSLPIGGWHVRIKASGFVPRFLWGLEISRGRDIDLGEISLKMGSSLIGRLVTEEGPVDPRHAHVELRPAIDRTLTTSAQNREFERLTEAVSVNKWGYFIFEAVPARTYELTANQLGFMPTSLRGIQVESNETLELTEPIVLQRALTLSVNIEPSEESEGVSWQVRLYESGTMKEFKRIEEGPTVNGEWLSPPLAAGQYTIYVVGSHGENNKVARQEIELSQGNQNVRIQLERVVVRGTVSLGGEPIAAHLWFGGRYGELIVEVEADNDGEFEVTLPHKGQWQVDVHDYELRVDTCGIEVEIDPNGDSGIADVEIELPGTELYGKVVDERGEPVSLAQVVIQKMDGPPGPSVFESDYLGRFEAHGLPPGDYSVEARDGELSSPMEIVTVSEEMTPAPLRLVLGRPRGIRGKVVSDSGPVPQAMVFGYPFTEQRSPAVSSIPQTRTEIDGSFELDLPGNTAFVRLIVLSFGFDFSISNLMRIEEDTSEPVVVGLSRQGGTLELAQATGFGVLVVNGKPVDLAILEGWARINGSPRQVPEELSVPAMPAGAYRYCDVRTVQMALLVLSGAAAPSSDACSEGFLVKGNRLPLAVP